METAVEKILRDETELDDDYSDFSQAVSAVDSSIGNQNKTELKKMTLKMLDDTCCSLALECISVSERPFFQNVSRAELMEKVSFLNSCLVPQTRFVQTCREQAWKKFYSSYVQEMSGLIQFMSSPRASAWLCLRLFEHLLDKNYPLSSKKEEHVRESFDLGEDVKDIVNYIGGSIVTKVRQRSSCLKATSKKDDILQCLDKFVDKTGAGEGNRLTTTLDRGGLVYLKPTAQNFFHFLEIQMRKLIKIEQVSCKSTDFENICSTEETITSAFNEVLYGMEGAGEAKDFLFAKVTRLYFKIRVHHECRMYMERWKAVNKTQKKGLRKSLKTSASCSSSS